MKLKSLVALSVTSALFMTANANALPLIDPYVGVTIGVGGITAFADGDSYSKSAQSYGAVVGFDIPIVRAEVAYDHLSSDMGDLNAGFINAYLKMPTPMISPYIGAGVGQIFDGDIETVEIKDAMAYQGMLGLTFNIPVLPFKVDAEARAIYAPDLFKVAATDIEPDFVHYDLRLKLRYIF